MLTIVVVDNMEIAQFDIKTAFLNGDLEKKLFMEMPNELNVEKSGLVCRLNKCLYRLHVYGAKNSKKFLETRDLIASKADQCVSIGQIDGDKIIFLLYVDDGSLLSSRKQALKTFL